MNQGKNIYFGKEHFYIDNRKTKDELKLILELVENIFSLNKMDPLIITIYEQDKNVEHYQEFKIEGIPVVFTMFFYEETISISFRTIGDIRNVVENGYEIQLMMRDPVFELIFKAIIEKNRHRLRLLMKYGNKPEKTKSYNDWYIYPDEALKFTKINREKGRFKIAYKNKFLFFKRKEVFTLHDFESNIV